MVEVDKDKQYYLLSKKHSPVQGMALWWGADNCGYSSNLLTAGKYLGKDIIEKSYYYNNDSTTPIECEEVEKKVEKKVGWMIDYNLVKNATVAEW